MLLKEVLGPGALQHSQDHLAFNDAVQAKGLPLPSCCNYTSLSAWLARERLAL